MAAIGDANQESIEMEPILEQNSLVNLLSEQLHLNTLC